MCKISKFLVVAVVTKQTKSHMNFFALESQHKQKKKWRTIPTSAIRRHTYANKLIRNNSRNNARAKFSWWKRWTNTKAIHRKKREYIKNERQQKKKRTVNDGKKIHNTCRICREKKKITLVRHFASELLVWYVHFRRSAYTLFLFYFCLCHLLNAVLMLWANTHDCTHHHTASIAWQQWAARLLWLSWHIQ